ncbi:MAG: S41 family peptidase [Bacteroidales bacterium]
MKPLQIKKIGLYVCLSLLWIGPTPTLRAQTELKENKNFEILKNLEIFSTAYKELELNYVDEIEPGSLIKTALDAMLRSLDPYTVYIPESDVEDYKIMTLGQYGGIGSTIHTRNGEVYISEPYKGFPADKANLKPGDKIIAINGEETKGKSSADVSTMLKGQAGTTFEITIERQGVSKPITVSLTRKEIKIDNVTFFELFPDSIGYIRLDGFTQGAAKEVKEAFFELKKQGMKALILDLRYNGGGLMNEAVQIVNLFCPKGIPVVSTKGKVEDKNTVYYTMDSPVDLQIPIVCLNSRATASASEIVSGALQDYDRAVIVGERTFGKGLVQNIIPLVYNSQMKITVSKYYIPSGRCVQAIDYSHRDEEGMANKIPDSLRTAFKTKAGRIVYDGYGIEPDVELEEEMTTNVGVSLITKFLIFDYANEFKRKQEKIGLVKEFEITDIIYKDFLNFMKDKDYSYETRSESLLKEFKKYAQADSCYKEVEPELEALKKSIAKTKENDLIKNKEEIKKMLKAEIASRYYYQAGRAEAELKGDKIVAKAVQVLNSTKEYSLILGQ